MKLSVEFFPPRNGEARERLLHVASTLQPLGPEYFSVTYGAGGSTREGTFDTVVALKRAGYAVAPHLSCVGSDKAELRDQLARYQSLGVNHVVALRGDLPSGDHRAGDFRYASQLVEFIRSEFGDHFYIEVAAYPEKHPQAKRLGTDIDHLVEKLKAGANAAITQYFFNADAFFHLRDALAARGVDLNRSPLIPGIMPIVNVGQLTRFSEQCGAEIPRWLSMALEDIAHQPEVLADFAANTLARLLARLRDNGVTAVHFYSLNQSAPLLRLMAAFRR